MPRWLPFQDLPAHAGALAVRERLAHSPFEQQYLIAAPRLGPYSLFRGLGHMLSPVLGALGAIRVIAVLPLWLVPLSTLWLRRKVSGTWDAAYALLGLYSTLGLMFMFGFASFLTGSAALIASYTIFLDLLESVRPVRAWLLAAFAGVATFYAHGFALLILGVLVLAAISHDAPLKRALRTLAALLPAAACVLWSQHEVKQIAAHVSKSEDAARTLFQGPLDKLSLLVSPMLVSRFGVDIAIGAALWGTLFYAAWRTRATNGESAARTRVQRGALLLFLLFAAAPHNAHWFGFVDARLLPTSYLLFAVSLPASWWSKRKQMVVGGAVLAHALLLGGAVLLFQGEMIGFEQALYEIPANTRLLNLPFSADSHYVVGHPFVHADKLLLIEQTEVLSDMWLHQGTGLYATDDNPAMRLPVGYSATTLHPATAWWGINSQEWDYALLRTDVDARQLEHDIPAGWCLRTQSEMWLVYQRDQQSHPCIRRP